jgi:hypothetical protein
VQLYQLPMPESFVRLKDCVTVPHSMGFLYLIWLEKWVRKGFKKTQDNKKSWTSFELSVIKVE